MMKKDAPTTSHTSENDALKNATQKLSNRLKSVWSQKFWDEEAERIELAYWELIEDRVPNARPPKKLRPTEHRIEVFVRQLSRKHKLGNLHVGLTSSDLEDNIRAKRLEESCFILDEMLAWTFIAISPIEWGAPKLIAYTHLMPAGVTDYYHRVAPTLFAQISVPKITYKGIGGAIGDSKIQGILGLFGELDHQISQTNEPKIGLTKREITSPNLR
jgi:adenylosuccinate lyase